MDVATGSLGQGLCAGVGMALNARRIDSDYRTYVLLGDGETAEGSVWEAARRRAERLDSLCAIVDVNALGQSRRRSWDHDMDAHAATLGRLRLARGRRRRPRPAGGARCLDQARFTKGRPTVILARTVKGKGISFVEGKGGWHGRALKKGEEWMRRSPSCSRSSCRKEAAARSPRRERARRARGNAGVARHPALRAR